MPSAYVFKKYIYICSERLLTMVSTTVHLPIQQWCRAHLHLELMAAFIIYLETKSKK